MVLLMEVYIYPILVLVFAAIFSREVVAPASRNACDRRWLVLAAGMGVCTLGVTIGVGYLFSASIRTHALIPLPAAMPDFVAGVICFLANSFVFYWWHRALHESDWLWRTFHQLHHSPQRIEALTAFFAHPLDTAAAVALNSVIAYAVLGASSLAMAWAILLVGLYDLYIHADATSPRWLGYFIQRPEMHRIHHARGHHADNYALPLWDLVFGTWNNPRETDFRLGFDDGKASAIPAMLLGRDVHKV